MACEVQAGQPGPLGPALRERYGFRPPPGVTPRCLPGGMSLRGILNPKVLPGVASGDQAELPGPRDGLGPVGGAELAQDMGDVLLDRVERHDQVVGDALV